MQHHLGKTLILVGILLIIVGILLLSQRTLPWLGKLPGDIHVEKDHVQFYFPMTTCLLLSALLSLVFWFFRK